MPSPAIAPQANIDLAAIATAVAERSPTKAMGLLRGYERTLRQLDAFPESGHHRADLPDEYRCIDFEDWLAVYRVEGGHAVVVRVAHRRQDLRLLELEGRS